MQEVRQIIKSTDELHELAMQLLEFAKGSNIIAIYGEMGTGKTTFIIEICMLLGVLENVSSPTFSIINEYSDRTRKPVYHFDFYRINEREAVDIGCVEYFDSGYLCLIEWPEKILNLLPNSHVKVIIEMVNTDRMFTFSHD